jgi:Ca-activated chloride channel family protein
VGYLLDEIRLHGENAEVRDEVTELARTFGIVTPYTAYLILEDEGRRDVPVSLRSLQNFEHDHAAREQAALSWSEFKTERSGDAGIAGARSDLALRSANAPAVAAAGVESAFARRYGLASAQGVAPAAPPVETSQGRLVQYAQQAKFVAGKTFFQNNDQWLDSAIQKATNATHVRLQFGSTEYFDFIAKHKEALPWLALGNNVQFVLAGTVYEVFQ